MSSRNALAEELEVLKSIFENDLKFDGSTIILTLSPYEEEEKKEVHVQVDLCITCSESYPKKEPHLVLKNIKGLTDNHVEILYCKLKTLSKAKVGEVMIFELAYCVREFLTENNKPGKKSCYSNLYEEMLIRKELQQQEEAHKQTKLIKEKQKEMLESTENDSSDGEEDEKTNFPNFHSENKYKLSNASQIDETCEHKNCKYIQFSNKIVRGRCIEHGSNSIIYCAIDSTTGDQLLLQEWIIKPKKKIQDTSVIEKSIECIQNELEKLIKLCHENLTSYIDYKCSLEKGDWVVQVLHEHIAGVNLNVFTEKNSDLDVNFIRCLIDGILNGLDYLHSHEIAHGCLDGSNIILSNLGCIKLSNYGIKKAIDDLHESYKNETPLPSKKISQKADILAIGHLLLKIMNLSSISNENILVPDFQPPELKEFVEKCLIENEEGRWSARKLLNHKFLRVKETKLNQPRKKLSGAGDLEIHPEEIEKPCELFFDENQNKNSRLAKDFKILSHLGNGSYGKVLKVKNKLDGSIYAIKAIRLNMKNKQLGKKMVREVKLLSKLNHENVVRYYTSWIEADYDSAQSSETTEEYDDIDGNLSRKLNKSQLLHESDDENDDEEEEDDEDEDEREEEEEEEEEEVDGIPKDDSLRKSNKESSYIVFEDSNKNSSSNKEDTSLDKSKETESRLAELNRTMYIQMEFCEKSTLRSVIKDTSSTKLCDDESRLWRLFREIVEGLAYVHEQGMIHRDLKPENIFLDSSDHVKIGDFGLATISAVSKCLISGSFANAGGDASSQNLYDDFHTGKVGTSLYVAPEVDKTFEKSYYNEKVDIYSLGIIFFEMCNGPFDTDMERIETLLNLRKFDTILPSNWEKKLPKQKNLIKMLLNHDPKSRPYCPEILEGDYLPPAEFEYEQFQDIMMQTLTNPKSKTYKYLVSSCFDQEVRIEDDITYQCENARSEKQHFILGLVKDRLENILKRRGAVYLSAPLLLPQSKEYKNIERRVKLMTHSGSIVSLPYDLRTSFARYVACKGITRFRRYALERVYREKKVHGLHPKEQFECAFDLVTPTSGSLNATVEVFSIMQDVVNEFKSLTNRNCVIRINHSLLLRALLIHFNAEKWYSNIFKILAEARESKYFKSKLESKLPQLGIQSLNILLNLFTKEESFHNIKKELYLLITKRAKALDVLNKAIDQLSTVISKAESSGIKVPIKIALGVVCNSEHCSNIMFDVAYQVKQKKKKEETIVLMSGCHYDGLIDKFRRLFELTGINTFEDLPSAIGVSIYLDKIGAILKEDNTLSEYVVICAFGKSNLSRIKEALSKQLWDSGIKCYVEETIPSLEELVDYCRENKIMQIVNLKDEESGILMTWDYSGKENHYQEKKIGFRDIQDHILKYSKAVEGHSSPLLVRQISECQKVNDSINGNQNFNTHIVFEEKPNANQRKRWESQLRVRVSSVVGIFSTKIKVEVVGVFLDEYKNKEVALNFKTAATSCGGDVEAMFDGNSSKKYISKIYDKIKSLLTENSNTVIILYSLPQDKYHFIMDC